MKSMSLRKLVIFVAANLLILGSVASDATAQMSDQQFEQAMTKFLASDKGQEALGKALQSYMVKQQEMARKQQEDQAKNDVESQFKNPVKIDAGKSPSHGPANARVTVIEFSDFQCPYCKRGADTMTELMKAYPNDVKVVFKHLPLPFHQQAEPAAKASLAAHKQGKFWEMHDALFNNQQKLSPEFYEETAKELKLDVDKFKKDMEAPDVAAQIAADKAAAEKNGIQGTPGFFVNGVAVRGAYPIAHFKMIVDRWLAKK